MWPRLGAWSVLVACAAAFNCVQPALRGLKRATTARGACEASMGAFSHAPSPLSPPPSTVSRRSALRGLVVLGIPGAAAAKDRKTADAPAPETTKTMSLDEFYAALEDQEVLTVEFDGPKFEVRKATLPALCIPPHARTPRLCDVRINDMLRMLQKCFVFMNNGGEYLISEGYPKESSVSSAGPQSVIGKIKNEIKSGNPVTWRWRGGDAFKKFSAAKKDVKVDKAEGNLSAEVAKRETQKKGGGLFGLSLPAPPKSLAQKAPPPPAVDGDDDE